MPKLNATELAHRLGLSRSRISQLLSQGRLEGTYTGTGRARRFDLDKVKLALLDPGQMARDTRTIEAGVAESGEGGDAYNWPHSDRQGFLIGDADTDRYELARIQKAFEEVRRLRRQNQEAEGQYVLASEVEPQISKMLREERAAFEAMLPGAAREIADQLGADFDEVLQTLNEAWQDHRKPGLHQETKK